MPIKMIVFDVDGTLSDHDKSISRYVSDILRGLDGKGIKVVLISGKNISYLSGLARGLGITDPLVIGENGALIFESNNQLEIRLASPDTQIEEIKNRVLEKYRQKIWIQPNTLCFTVFPKNKDDLAEIYDYIDNFVHEQNRLILMKHTDAIDLIPKNVSKVRALTFVKKNLGIKTEEIIAFGDSPSDIPMSPEVKIFFVIGNKITADNAVQFPNIQEALAALVKSL